MPISPAQWLLSDPYLNPSPTLLTILQALEFFQQLAASRTATLDVTALNCLAAVHAAAGQTEEAEQAVARAGQLAAMQGMPPPPEATYALVQVSSRPGLPGVRVGAGAGADGGAARAELSGGDRPRRPPTRCCKWVPKRHMG